MELKPEQPDLEHARPYTENDKSKVALPPDLEHVLQDLGDEPEQEKRPQGNLSLLKYYKPLVKRPKITLKMEEENYISLSEEDIRYKLEYYPSFDITTVGQKAKFLADLNQDKSIMPTPRAPVLPPQTEPSPRPIQPPPRVFDGAALQKVMHLNPRVNNCIGSSSGNPLMVMSFSCLRESSNSRRWS
jgi:hypothetical protein